MASQTLKHIVIACAPGWGHTRPQCSFAARTTCEYHDIAFTLLIPPNLYSKCLVEFSNLTEPIRQRIRLVNLFDLDTPDFMLLFQKTDENYPALYQTLVDGKPIHCVKSGTTFDALPPPSVVIIDFFSVNQLDQTRAITGTSIPILGWGTGGATSVYMMHQSHARLLALAADEVKRTGESWGTVTTKYYNASEGILIHPPGLPPLYDYELHPQVVPFEPPVGPMILGCGKLLEDSDGVIIGGSAMVLEPAAIHAIEKTFSPRPVITLGPLVPPTFWDPNNKVAERDEVFVKFLDGMKARFGSGSVLLIAFGTIFWPANFEYLEEVIEALLEAQFPFIFSHASPFATIPEAFAKRVEQSGIGLLSPWSPQHLILNHTAVGWFLTHGGAGGVTESLASGVPLILWPFTGDQPLIAKTVTHTLNLGFELHEIKTALGKDKPIYDIGRTPAGTREAVGKEFRDVIRKVRGKEGEEIKMRAGEKKIELQEAWSEGGAAKRSLRGLVERYT